MAMAAAATADVATADASAPDQPAEVARRCFQEAKQKRVKRRCRNGWV